HGVLVKIESGTGALLVNLIVGTVPTAGQGVVYVRRPDQDQTWAAQAASNAQLPPLRNVAAWLNLKPLDLPADQLTSVVISPPSSRPYILARADATQPWRLTSPALATPASVDSTAEKITQLTPIDVQPAPAIQGAATGHLQISATPGIVIDAEL